MFTTAGGQTLGQIGETIRGRMCQHRRGGQKNQEDYKKTPHCKYPFDFGNRNTGQG